MSIGGHLLSLVLCPARRMPPAPTPLPTAGHVEMGLGNVRTSSPDTLSMVFSPYVTVNSLKIYKHSLNKD